MSPDYVIANSGLNDMKSVVKTVVTPAYPNHLREKKE